MENFVVGSPLLAYTGWMVHFAKVRAHTPLPEYVERRSIAWRNWVTPVVYRVIRLILKICK